MSSMNVPFAPAVRTGAASFPERSRTRLIRALQIGGRLIGVAAARLAFRRGQTALAASGAALAAAMLALTLATQAGVEDRTFTARLGLQREAAPNVFSRSLTVSVGLDDRTRRSYREIDQVVRRRLAAEGWKPIATAFATVPGGLIAMGDRLERFLRADEGRLPRTCTPRLCEFVWMRPPPETAGVLPPPSRPPAIPGFRFRLVGTAHQIGPAPLLDFPMAVTRGFGLLGSEEVARGGVLGWHVPLKEVVDHPWNLDGALRRAAAARSDLGARLEQVDVDVSAASLQQARAKSTAGGRRLLIVAGSLAAIFLAYLLFVGARLREDVQSTGERLAASGASRWQVRTIATLEVGGAALVGSVAGWLLGGAAAVWVVSRLGGAGWPAAAHALTAPVAIALGVACAAAVTGLVVLAATMRPLSLAGRSLDIADVAAIGAVATLAAGFAQGALDPGRLAAGEGSPALLLVAPALVGLVAAVVAGRLVGPALRALERLARRASPVLRLSALTVVRRPGEAAVLAGFLSITLGLSLFLAVYRSTLERGRRDELAYAAPTAFRLTESLSRLVPVTSVPLGDIPGATKLPVLRLSGDAPRPSGSVSFTLLGVPASALPALDGWRSDFSALSPRTIAAKLAARRDTSFEAIPLPRSGELTMPMAASGDPVDISATFVSASGTFKTVQVATTADHVLRLRGPAGMRAPRLVALGFEPGGFRLRGNPQAGELRDIVAVGKIELGPTRALDFRRFVGSGGITARITGRTARLRFAVGTSEAARFALREPTAGHPVPVAVSPAIAAGAGASGLLPLDVLGARIVTRIVAVVRHFPTTHGDVVVADRGTVATAINATSPGPPFYNEVWIDDPAPRNVARELERSRFRVLDVTSREALATASTSSTVARAARLLLAAGAFAGLVLTLLGVALASTTELRRRRGELLDLEAQGMEPRALAAFVRLRILLVSCVGACVALAAGIVMSLLVVETVRIALGDSTPDPPLVLDLEWPLLLGGFVGVGAAIALVADGVARLQLRRTHGVRL
jgi:hypothetical protein